MGWRLIEDGAGRKIWRASEYTDLQYADINNLAQWGQPNSPYEDGYNHEFVPDFKNVIVQIPHEVIMNDGHGKHIAASNFPIADKFLKGQIQVQNGCYSFRQLKDTGKLPHFRRTIHGNLYGTGSIPTTSGAISNADAAYIYGSVGYALMRSTRYVKCGHYYTIRGEIGVLDDNWDFQSDNPIAKALNPLIAAIFGPSHYNLEPNPNAPGDAMGRIDIEYIGDGKPFYVRNFSPPK